MTDAALDELGRLLGTEAFPTTTAGYRALLSWLNTYGGLELPEKPAGLFGSGRKRKK